MKQQYGVDRMLQKVQQELDTNVPVLEGTDVQEPSKHHLLRMRATYGWEMNHFTNIFTYIYAYNITHRHRVLPRPTTMMLYDFR